MSLRPVRIVTLLAAAAGLALLGAPACGGVFKGPRCYDPLVSCGEFCIDPREDANNCGGCGIECDDGDICTGGSCRPLCVAGTALCGDVCAQTSFDPRNCGGCGFDCGEGRVCSGGTCGDECTGGTTRCGDRCIDTSVDPDACGGCGRACDPGRVCVVGECRVDCPPGLEKCGDRCVDVFNDPAHCGGCDVKCPPDRLCASRQCAESCSGGTTACEGRCVDVEVDPANCGECGVACAPDEICSAGQCGLRCTGGTTRCGNRCVDTDWDPANCGECANPCPRGKVCSEGACRDDCTGGTIRCGDLCIFVDDDEANCGACGRACAEGELCVDGECQLNCLDPFTFCDGECVNLEFDARHCSRCGRSCGNARVCWRAECLSPTFDGTTGDGWQRLAEEFVDDLPSISEVIPAGQDTLYLGRDDRFFSFSQATGWRSETPPSLGSAQLGSYARTGPSLFVVDGAEIEARAGGRWTLGSLDRSAATGTQMAHDDQGSLYYVTPQGGVMRARQDGTEVRESTERENVWRPRVAWDSLTERLYVAPRFDINRILEYDPLSDTFIELQPPPVAAIGSAFCSDRSGHIYIRAAAGQLWHFTVWTQTWEPIPEAPFSMHPGGVCTVDLDGWLYVYRAPFLARIRLNRMR